MISPITYYGGKKRLANWIISHFPKNYRTLHYIEPFAGGLAVLFKKRKSILESINDLDGDLINFWEVLKDEKMSKELFEMAKHQLCSEELRDRYRDRLFDKNLKKNKVERAFYYFYTKSFTFSNLKRGGFSYIAKTRSSLI